MSSFTPRLRASFWGSGVAGWWLLLYRFHKVSLDISRALRASRGDVLVGGEGGECIAGFIGGDAPTVDRSSLFNILTYSAMRDSKSPNPDIGIAVKKKITKTNWKNYISRRGKYTDINGGKQKGSRVMCNAGGRTGAFLQSAKPLTRLLMTLLTSSQGY